MSNGISVIPANVFYLKARGVIKEFEGEDGKYNFTIKIKTINDVKLGIKKINLMKKQLQNIKREMNQEILKIKKYFSELRGTVQAGFISSVAGRSFASRDRAMKRIGVNAERDKNLDPYNKVMNFIIASTTALDSLKFKMEEYLSKATP